MTCPAESVPEWLADRLARLNFRAPTLVQTNALRAILSGDDAAVLGRGGGRVELRLSSILLTVPSPEGS